MDIIDYLHQFKGQKIFYCTNPGSVGDALIAYGTLRLFATLGLKVELISIDNPPDLQNQIVLYGGGGNFIHYYGDCAKFCRSVHQKVRKLVILPHTISNHHAELLQAFGSNVDIICRELHSYQQVRAEIKAANLYLMHDLALAVSAADIENLLKRRFYLKGSVSADFRKHIEQEKQRFFRVKQCHQKLRQQFQEQFPQQPLILHCLRTDAEKIDITLPPDNIDLPMVSPNFLHLHTTQPQLLGYTVKEFLDFINHYDVVVTNRLHVGIAAALLGKTVQLYPNNYWKVQAVYEYSLKTRFPKVQWMPASTIACAS